MAEDKRSRDTEQARLTETLKKLMTAGLGAAFMTEESIRSYLGELKLPKDVLNALLQSAHKSKQDLLDKVGEEIVKIISRIDFVSEASRFVEEHKFRITAEIEVLRRPEAGSSPETSAPEQRSGHSRIVVR